MCVLHLVVAGPYLVSRDAGEADVVDLLDELAVLVLVVAVDAHVRGDGRRVLDDVGGGRALVATLKSVCLPRLRLVVWLVDCVRARPGLHGLVPEPSVVEPVLLGLKVSRGLDYANTQEVKALTFKGLLLSNRFLNLVKANRGIVLARPGVEGGLAGSAFLFEEFVVVRQLFFLELLGLVGFAARVLAVAVDHVLEGLLY